MSVRLLLAPFVLAASLTPAGAQPAPGTSPPGSALQAGGAAATPPAEGGGEDKPEPRYTYGASADFYFSSNLNNPFNARNALRFYDYRDEHGPHLNLLDLWLEGARRPVGFRLDLVFGSGAYLINVVEPSRGDVWQNLLQAYGSVNLDRSGSTYLDFGKYITPAGAESFFPHENWLYSAGLLYAWAIPSYHFGFRLNHYFNDDDYVAGMLHRGWSAVGDPGHGPGYGLTGSKKLGEQWVLTGTFLGGDENDAFGRSSWRGLWDVVASYTPPGRWSFLFNADYGLQTSVRTAPGKQGRTSWYGLSGIWKYQLGKSDYLAGRADWLRDDTGFLFGDDLDTYCVSLGYARFLTPHLRVGAEYRHDFAGGGRPFAGSRRGVFEDNEGTFVLSTVLSY